MDAAAGAALRPHGIRERRGRDAGVLVLGASDAGYLATMESLDLRSYR